MECSARLLVTPHSLAHSPHPSLPLLLWPFPLMKCLQAQREWFKARECGIQRVPSDSTHLFLEHTEPQTFRGQRWPLPLFLGQNASRAEWGQAGSQQEWPSSFVFIFRDSILIIPGDPLMTQCSPPSLPLSHILVFSTCF